MFIIRVYACGMKFDIFPPNSPNPFDSEKKLRVKFGIDPTAPRLHLGHLVPMRLVKKFNDEGHSIRLILGTFTAQLGDPSGRDKARPILTSKECQENAATIKAVINRIFRFDFDKINGFWFNHIWFGAWSASQLISFIGKFNVEELLARDAFQKRMEANSPIATHELIVPLLQGWDSVQVGAEVEIGGIDQLFNFQITRKVQTIEGKQPEVCLMTPIINGTDGRKMSKTFDNCIFLDEDPKDIFGKVMSIPDGVMEEWIPLFSETTPPSDHPMKRKKWLAWEITNQIWGCKDADAADVNFQKTVQDKEKPDNIPSLIATSLVSAVAVIRNCSKSDATRLIHQGGVKINDIQSDIGDEIKSGDLIQVGKRNFGRII